MQPTLATHLTPTVLLLTFLTVLGIGQRAQAEGYTWGSAANGNWSDSTKWTPATAPGEATLASNLPTNNADTVTIDATGSDYTVTVDGTHGYTIGDVTLNSANATLNASKQLRISAAANFSAGSIQGTFDFMAPGASLSVDKSNVTVTGPTTYKFNRCDGISVWGDGGWVGGGNYDQTFNAGNLSTNESLSITQTDTPYPRGYLNVTTPSGYENNGSIYLGNSGGTGATLTYTLTSGNLTNRNSMSMNTGGSMTLNAGVVNEATGVLIISSPGSGNVNNIHLYLGRETDAHVNRGLIRVDGTLNHIRGTTLNDTGGVIRNNGATATLLTTWNNLAIWEIDNALGTIQAVGGDAPSTFTIVNGLSASTRDGSTLKAGNYTVTGGSASTTLTLSGIGGAGTITALGAASGNPATVTFTNSTATFTQLESASGSLATIHATGTLNILGGKSFTSAATLANGGTIVVGTGSTNKLGSAGTGTLTVGAGGTLSGNGTVTGNTTIQTGGKLKPLDTGNGVPSKITISETFAYENGTLDLSGLTSVADGTHVIAQFPSRSVVRFASVVSLPAGKVVGYTDTQITLGPPSGTVIMMR